MYMTGLAVPKMSLILTVNFFHCGRGFPSADYETQHSLDNAVRSTRSFRCSVSSATYISGARFFWYAGIAKNRLGLSLINLGSTIKEWQPYGFCLCSMANGTAGNYCVAFSIPDQQGVREL